jgi:hypothetical protein
MRKLSGESSERTVATRSASAAAARER